MTRLNAREKQCKRLFNVKTPPEKQSYIAVSCTGELLLVTEELAGMVLHYGEITYFRLDHREFVSYVQKAQRNGKLQKAINKQWTSMAEIERLCGGKI